MARLQEDRYYIFIGGQRLIYAYLGPEHSDAFNT
jgi:hypothetical protein